MIELARYQIADKNIEGNEILFKRHFVNSKINYITFEDKAPSPIAKAFSIYKLFNQNNSLIITVENDAIGTSLYKIDLESLKLTEKFFKYPKGKLSDYEEFNSYISNNNIFQIAVSNKEMSLSINNLEDSYSKEYYTTKNDEITFKNTMIKQKGITMIPFQGNRGFETTSKFLRKVSSESVGVNIYYTDGDYEITIGGLKDNVAQGLLIVSGSGLGGLTSLGIGIDLGQITKITGLFNENFQHINKDLELNSFDLLSEFEKNLKFDKNSNAFYANGNIYYSYVHKKEKALKFLKF